MAANNNPEAKVAHDHQVTKHLEAKASDQVVNNVVKVREVEDDLIPKDQGQSQNQREKVEVDQPENQEVEVTSVQDLIQDVKEEIEGVIEDVVEADQVQEGHVQDLILDEKIVEDQGVEGEIVGVVPLEEWVEITMIETTKDDQLVL